MLEAEVSFFVRPSAFTEIGENRRQLRPLHAHKDVIRLHVQVGTPILVQVVQARKHADG
jgi:hypothetical protein